MSKLSDKIKKTGKKNTGDDLKLNLSQGNTSNLNESNIQVVFQEKKEENWRVGILCVKDCYFLVMEILKCLERMFYEWKLVSSSYKIKCRKKNEEHGQSSKSLNVLIQVFGVS